MTKAYQWPTPTFIGFERLFDEIERVTSLSGSQHPNSSYPPYNLIKSDEDNYTVQLAVAGFTQDNITITVNDGVLTIEGGHKETEDNNTYVHKGISSRRFRRTFNLAEYVEVKDATMVDGILSIELQRILPDEKKPRIVKINSSAAPEFIQE